MSIDRISDSLVADLPTLLLEASYASNKNKLDASDFKESYTLRDYTDKFLPVMSIISYTDILSELNKYTDLSSNDKTLILEAIKKGLEQSAKLVTAITTEKLYQLIQDIALNQKLSDTQKAINIRGLFTKGYVITDTEAVLGSAEGKVFIVHNFAAMGTRINKYVNTYLKEYGKDTLGKYLDLGHSSVRYGDTSKYAFNSPKQTAVLFDINTTSASSFISKSVNLNTAATIFATKTEQLEQSVTVTKEFGDGFISIFVQFGGSVVTLENSIENQERGRTLERAEKKFGVNKTVLTKLVSKFKHIKDTAVLGQYNTTEIGRIIRNLVKYTSSPSAIDHIVHQIKSTLLGTKVEVFKQTATRKKVEKVTHKEKIKLPNVLSTGKTFAARLSQLRNIKGQFSSLSNLQSIINASLQDVISANMGSGNRKDILNYRTGRLAASAQVERMSQSREGMITAFYSYMKNPYATFSEGGRQQDPRSRDPKLLISKSIREIAATHVANRMRAVSI